MGSYTPTPFQFAGDWGYQSEFAAAAEQGTGLQYLEQRYYDPAIGRFLSPDPIGFLGGLNLYGYADNDPVMNLDPSGLRWKEWLSLAGGLIGAAVGAPEGGVGAISGGAYGAGLGAAVGSRLDGASVGRSVVNGVVEGGFTYVGGRLTESAIAAYRLRQAAQAARAAQAVRQTLEAEAEALALVRQLGTQRFNIEIIGVEQRKLLGKFLLSDV
jgi:RHS repeat-associated protein